MEGLVIAVFGEMFMFGAGIVFGAVRADYKKTLLYGSLILAAAFTAAVVSGNVLRILVDNHSDNAARVGTILGIVLFVGVLSMPFGIGATIAGGVKLIAKENAVK